MTCPVSIGLSICHTRAHIYWRTEELTDVVQKEYHGKWFGEPIHAPMKGQFQCDGHMPQWGCWNITEAYRSLQKSTHERREYAQGDITMTGSLYIVQSNWPSTLLLSFSVMKCVPLHFILSECYNSQVTHNYTQPFLLGTTSRKMGKLHTTGDMTSCHTNTLAHLALLTNCPTPSLFPSLLSTPICNGVIRHHLKCTLIEHH